MFRDLWKRFVLFLTEYTPQEAAQRLPSAVQSGQIEAVRTCLARGADANVTDRHGWPLLRFAIQSGSVEVVKSLLEAGADPNSRGRSGPGNCYAYSPLYVAADKSNTEMVEVLLKSGADPNSVEPAVYGDQTTPLGRKGVRGEKGSELFFGLRFEQNG